MLVYLAKADLFKTVYELEPSEIQRISGIVHLPWVFKIVYGLITDNFPIFDSRRKSYLFINAVLNFVSLNVLAYNRSNYIHASICLFMVNFSVAFSDVIVDSLMVI